MTPQHQRQAAIVERLQAGHEPLEICMALDCTLAEVTVLAGKYRLAPRSAPGEAPRKGARREPDKHHYITSVLDKASTERVLRPLPARIETTGPDGRRVVLSMPPAPANPKP